MKTIRKQYENDPKTIRKRYENDTKTIRKRCVDVIQLSTLLRFD